MAKKLDRPLTFAEKVYLFSQEQWFEHVKRRQNGSTRSKASALHIRKILEPKIELLRKRVIEARKFTLSEDVRNVIEEHVQDASLTKLEALVETARLPFDSMWFEDNSQENESHNMGILMWRVENDDGQSWLASVFVADKTDKGYEYWPTPATICVGPAIQSRLHQYSPDVAFTDREKKVILQAWGTKPDISDVYFNELVKLAIVQVDTYLLLPLLKAFPNMKDYAYRAFDQAGDYLAGFIPGLVRLVALINSPAVTLDLRASKGFFQYRLKNHPFLTANTITLNIAPHKLIKYINNQTEEHIKVRHRAHEVRGFWRHYLEKDHCDFGDHDWNCMGDDVNLHHCSHCASRRRWIKEHMRGDAGLGFVEHKYTVIHEPERTQT